jgi:hypothetical protein
LKSIEGRHRIIDDKYIGIQGVNGLDGLLAIATELTTSNSSPSVRLTIATISRFLSASTTRILAMDALSGVSTTKPRTLTMKIMLLARILDHCQIATVTLPPIEGICKSIAAG